MPISLPPLNRRQFLAGAAATLAAVRQGLAAETAPEANLDRWALFSDTHINQQRDLRVRDVNMADNLQAVVKEALAEAKSLAAVIVNGDCAHLRGQPQDYALLLDLVKPLLEAGLTIHCALGNHDHRERFYAAGVEPLPEKPLVPDKHVRIIETPRANWFILDSLAVTNNTAGTLGEDQMAWLAKALDAHKDKPALVIGHHNPQIPLIEKQFGLTDTEQFLKTMTARKHVQCYIHGHSHRWGLLQQQGLRLVQLPATAYVFEKGEPNGWTLATLGEKGVTFKLNALNKKHLWNGQELTIDWRM